MTALDGNDRRAVRKMVRDLIKHGTWERNVTLSGSLSDLSCGAVTISSWHLDGKVDVIVGDLKIADSNLRSGWDGLGKKAEKLFHKHRQALIDDAYAKARLALLKAEAK